MIARKVSAVEGTIGGFTIGSSTIKSTDAFVLDAGNKKIGIFEDTGATDFGDNGIQLELDSDEPRFYVGDGAQAFVRYEHSNNRLRIGGGVEISGSLRATEGTIGGFSITSNAISSSATPKRGLELKPGEAIRGYGNEVHTTVSSVGKFSFNPGGSIAPPAGGSTQFDPAKAPVPGNITL